MEPNATLQHAIGVKSFNTLKEVRNKLQQFDMIRFKSRNGSGNVEYDIYDVERQTFSKFDEVSAKVTDQVVDEVSAKVTDEVEGKHYVLLKPKPKQKGESAFIRIYDLKYFQSIGFEIELGEELSESLNEFLLYRNQHPDHGPIKSHQQIEGIIRGFSERKVLPENASKMLRYTIERGAKNVIYELPISNKNQNNGTGKPVSQPWRT